MIISFVWKTIQRNKVEKLTTSYQFKHNTFIYVLLDSLSIAQTFKIYYSSLAENLVLKLPKPLNNFRIQSVNNYYKKCNLNERLLFLKIESDKAFKILKHFNESKAPDIDDL